MASATLPQIKDVDIDPQGVFKYILVKVTGPTAEGRLQDKVVVRGYADCAFHADINDKVTGELQGLKAAKQIRDWRSMVLGGGRINHDAAAKKIEVYGYSQGYGKADHRVAVDILKTEYPDYEISFSDAGY